MAADEEEYIFVTVSTLHFSHLLSGSTLMMIDQMRKMFYQTIERNWRRLINSLKFCKIFLPINMTLTDYNYVIINDDRLTEGKYHTIKIFPMRTGW